MESENNETKQKYLSLAEASKFFGIPQNYLNVLIHRNKIEGKKLGRNWYTGSFALTSRQFDSG